MSGARRIGVEEAAFASRPLEPLPADLPCRSAAVDMWFAHDPVLVEEAKALCRRCVCRVPCLDGALARNEPWGVWGGELIENGLVIPRRRPRGRPRKDRAEAG